MGKERADAGQRATPTGRSLPSAQPRESFQDHEENTPWDPLHRAYFNGYALWSYLTMPFLFTVAAIGLSDIRYA
ncbi:MULTISPECIES: hypothetical protein [Pseudomonas]|jgi:hypothetical protein|uniref:hypothetical protein n=1 Tax=Pseudomonas TaxID=286 RepID=UPI00069C3079|nr:MULTISPECIES: hypothetical protein [Pseudomonas]OOG15448.1 hypothetical protein BMS17_26230 [Pseudomonas sp. C9]